MSIIKHEIDLSNHLLKGGPKFCTHRATLKDESHLYFRPTKESMLFASLYFVMGAVLFAIAAYIYFYSKKVDLTIFIVSFGVALCALGVGVAGDYVVRIHFDKSHGIYAKGHHRPVELDNIVGLQINEKHMLSYATYELNMLTKGGRRLNIVCHGHLEQMTIDAKQLANFLNIPDAYVRDYTRLHNDK